MLIYGSEPTRGEGIAVLAVVVALIVVAGL